jgi:hypothetical protein
VPGGAGGVLQDVTNVGTVAIAPSESIYLKGTFTNKSVLRMDSTAGTAANLLTIGANTTLAGTGTLQMSNSANNYITATNDGDTLTIAPAATIRGSGFLNIGFFGGNSHLLNYVNHGTIEAAGSAALQFRLANSVHANLTNDGDLRCAGGSALYINSLDPATVFNAGGTITALDKGIVRITANTTLEGGTITTLGTGEIHGDIAGSGSGVFSNVTNTGAMVLANGELMRISGNFVNNGVLRMNDTQGTGTNLYFSNTTITGTGTIALTDSSTNYIYATNSGETLKIGQTMTLRGGAQISPGFQGTGILNVVNQGLMESTSYLRVGLSNDVNANMLNTGTFRAAAGATIEMHAFSVGCKLTNGGGNVEVLAGSNFNVDPNMQLLQNSGTTNLSGGTMTAPFGLDLNGGKLIGNGTFAGPIRNHGGKVAPGLSLGKMTVNGNYTQTAKGVLSMEIGGGPNSANYDQLVVNGSARIGGILRLRLRNGFIPAASAQFTIVASQSIIDGSFTNVPNGARLQTTDGAGSFVVTYRVLNDAALSQNVTLSNFKPAPKSNDPNHPEQETTGAAAENPVDRQPEAN